MGLSFKSHLLFVSGQTVTQIINLNLAVATIRLVHKVVTAKPN